MSATACPETRLAATDRVGMAGPDRTGRLEQVWRAAWAPAMDTELYVEPLASPSRAAGCGDLQRGAPTPHTASLGGQHRPTADSTAWC